METTRARRGLGWWPLALAGALALWWYQPWKSRAFDVADFSEFLPILTGAHGVRDRFAGLVDYYAGAHGRFNLLTYAALAAKWSWLPRDPLVWQLLRATLLLLIAALAYRLLRRLAADRAAAALGAVLLLFSYSAALPWIRLTMGEPLGLLLMLTAALLAAKPAGLASSRGIGAGVALLVALAILAKEMLVLWVPVVLAVGLTRTSSGTLAGLRRDRAGARFALFVLVGAVAAAIPVLLIARRPGVSGYAATYGAASLSLDRFGEIFQRQFLPWPITGRTDATVMLIAALLFLGVILVGMRSGLQDPAWRKHSTWVLLLGLGLPVLGALAYLPWPVYAPFYGYAFCFGSALLLATALTALRRSGPRPGALGFAAAGLSLVLAVPHAVHLARAAAAQQETLTGLARVLPGPAGADRLVVAVPGLPAQAWQGLGPSLTRYAMATGLAQRLPPAVDLLCADAARLLGGGRGRPALATLSTGCGTLTGASRTVLVEYSYWQWQPPGWRKDSVRADLLLPEAGMAPPPPPVP